MLVFIVASNASSVMSRIDFCALLPPGVVDEDVEPAEPLDRVGDEPAAEGRVAQVAGDGDRLASGGADQVDDLARVGLLGRVVVDRDVGPFAGIGDRRGAAHAEVAAGDQRLAPHQPAVADVARLAVVGARVHLRREAGPRLLLVA